VWEVHERLPLATKAKREVLLSEISTYKHEGEGGKKIEFERAGGAVKSAVKWRAVCRLSHPKVKRKHEKQRRFKKKGHGGGVMGG